MTERGRGSSKRGKRGRTYPQRSYPPSENAATGDGANDGKDGTSYNRFSAGNQGRTLYKNKHSTVKPDIGLGSKEKMRSEEDLVYPSKPQNPIKTTLAPKPSDKNAPTKGKKKFTDGTVNDPTVKITKGTDPVLQPSDKKLSQEGRKKPAETSANDPARKDPNEAIAGCKPSDQASATKRKKEMTESSTNDPTNKSTKGTYAAPKPSGKAPSQKDRKKPTEASANNSARKNPNETTAGSTPSDQMSATKGTKGKRRLTEGSINDPMNKSPKTTDTASKPSGKTLTPKGKKKPTKTSAKDAMVKNSRKSISAEPSDETLATRSRNKSPEGLINDPMMTHLKETDPAAEELALLRTRKSKESSVDDAIAKDSTGTESAPKSHDGKLALKRKRKPTDGSGNDPMVRNPSETDTALKTKPREAEDLEEAKSTKWNAFIARELDYRSKENALTVTLDMLPLYKEFINVYSICLGESEKFDDESKDILSHIKVNTGVVIDSICDGTCELKDLQLLSEQAESFLSYVESVFPDVYQQRPFKDMFNSRMRDLDEYMIFVTDISMFTEEGGDETNCFTTMFESDASMHSKIYDDRDSRLTEHSKHGQKIYDNKRQEAERLCNELRNSTLSSDVRLKV